MLRSVGRDLAHPVDDPRCADFFVRFNRSESLLAQRTNETQGLCVITSGMRINRILERAPRPQVPQRQTLE